MGPQLIALYSPLPQSGKSTVAQALVSSRDFALVKFADPFRSGLLGALRDAGIPERQCRDLIEGPLKETTLPYINASIRDLLMGMGEGARQQAPDVWAYLAKAKAQRLLKEGMSVVIDDLRRPNEYEAVISLGGTPVKVHRPGVYSRYSSNEGLLESYPMVELTNNGTLAQLRACAEGLPELIANGTP